MNRQPNIVFVIADDQHVADVVAMPHTAEYFAQRGAVFENCITTNSWCAPARASVLTGLYVHSHQCQAHSDFKTKGMDQRTIATELSSLGYECGLVGKYINGYSSEPTYIPPGWESWSVIVDENVYYDYRLCENGKLVQYGDKPEDYVTDILTRKGIEFLEQTTERPFLLYIGNVAPHVPCDPASRHDGLPVDTSDVDLKFLEDLTRKPRWVRDYRKRNTPHLINYFSDPGLIEKRRRSLLAVDDMLMKLIETLHGLGKLENTVIVYTSDHSDGISTQIPVSPKLSPYDDCIRIPLFISGPEIATARVVSDVVSGVDFFPTLVSLAGGTEDDRNEGTSLLPLLRPGDSWEADGSRIVLTELAGIGDWPWKSTPPMFRLMRSNSYKYVEYITGEKEYYLIEADPNEKENIYEDLSKSRQRSLHQMMEQLSRWQEWNRVMENRKVHDYIDDIHDVWKRYPDSPYPYNYQSISAKSSHLLAALPALRGHRVLDIGCNTGLYSLCMAPFCEEVVGIDIAPKMLEMAEAAKDLLQERAFDLSNLSFSQTSIDAIQMFDGKIDAILASCVLYHFSDEQLQDLANFIKKNVTAMIIQARPDRDVRAAEGDKSMYAYASRAQMMGGVYKTEDCVKFLRYCELTNIEIIEQEEAYYSERFPVVIGKR